jgi:hypothetical protein
MLQLLLAASLLAADPDKPFAITVVDAETNRGVPCVELRTVNGIRLFTDSNGHIAFNEPGVMNESVFFHVSGHGYDYPKDGFGFRGKQVKVTPGGSERLKINRVNIAERLYRVTGGGIYRDSLLLGKDVPLKEPSLNAKVVGSDSVMNAIYRGKLYWFWGDTLQPGYPLGNYNVPGATSELSTKGGLDPARGVNLTYFADEKCFAKKTCDMPGKGPTWVETIVTLNDKDGKERLLVEFVKIEAPLKVYARGLAMWNDDKQQFEKVRDIDLKTPAIPRGQAFKHRDGDKDYVYFATPYPLVRVPATAEAFVDPSQYEAFTCLKEGGSLEAPQLDRDTEGRLCYAWKKNTPAVGMADQARLVSSGKMKLNESPFSLRDRDTGKAITAHTGSVNWNEHRKRWVMILVEHYGKPSLLGEVWYAESDAPTGPWLYAVKIATHDRYDFYNPKQHPMFDQRGGRVIYFEGTYTHTFSGNPDFTPRYEYNQMMYRLDLDDPGVALPRPVAGTDFLALDRSVKGALPIPPEGATKFYILPEGKNVPAATVPLYQFTKGDEKRYATSETLAGYERSAGSIGRVWPGQR